jgi:hypothetical protein
VTTHNSNYSPKNGRRADHSSALSRCIVSIFDSRDRLSPAAEGSERASGIPLKHDLKNGEEEAEMLHSAKRNEPREEVF